MEIYNCTETAFKTVFPNVMLQVVFYMVLDGSSHSIFDLFKYSLGDE